MTENKPLINLEHVQLKQTVTQKHNNKEEGILISPKAKNIDYLKFETSGNIIE